MNANAKTQKYTIWDQAKRTCSINLNAIRPGYQQQQNMDKRKYEFFKFLQKEKQLRREKINEAWYRKKARANFFDSAATKDVFISSSHYKRRASFMM